jgi:hypothetical protein
VRRDDGPRPLADSLRQLTARYRRVDLNAMVEIKKRWPDVLGATLADHCAPEVVRGRTLFVRVPSGAFAARVRDDERRILAAFADLGEHAPTAISTTVRPPRGGS